MGLLYATSKRKLVKTKNEEVPECVQDVPRLRMDALSLKILTHGD